MRRAITLVLLIMSTNTFSATFNLKLHASKPAASSGGNPSLLSLAAQSAATDGYLNLFCQGSPEAAEKLGGIIQTRAGRYFTMRFPLSRLPELEKENTVETAELGPAFRPLLNAATASVSASQAWAAGFEGNGVLIGLIDTGIDTTHPDFKNDNGLSRIEYLWDQKIANPQVIPEGFTYGREWNKGEIDRGECKDQDDMYHGTHVAGCAAGNGKASNGLYKGIAPKTGLVVVKVRDDNLSHLVDAVSYILQKAVRLGRPCVINISMGTQAGSHTADDPYNKAIDALLDKYGHEGHIIIWAASNEGNLPVHARENIGPAAYATFYLNSVSGSANTAEFWSPVSTRVCVIDGFGNTNLGWVSAAGGLFTTSQVTLNARRVAGEYKYELNISPSSSGNWRIVFETNTQATPVDCYLPEYGTDLSSSTFGAGTTPDQTYTLNTFACQQNSLAIAALTTRVAFTNQYNALQTTSYTLDTWPDFSSIGPARDSQEKPDFCAPGAMIISALNRGTNNTKAPSYMKISTNYLALAGTSMAAPVAAGSAALMLEKEPRLTVSELKARLKTTVRKPAGKSTAGVYDAYYGYGAIDLSTLPLTAASAPTFEYQIKNNVLSVNSTTDSVMSVIIRSTAVQSITARVELYNTMGGLVRTLGSGDNWGIEVNEYVWDGKDKNGSTVQPGVYFLLLTLGGRQYREPVLIIR